MNRIYVERQVMAPPTGVEAPPAGSDGDDPAPEAVEALRHLAESFELVILGDPGPSILGAFGGRVRGARGLPTSPAHGSWLLTHDPETCVVRPPGLKTILVGPRRAPTNRPAPRCDVEARDLSAAVVEILTREAMA